MKVMLRYTPSLSTERADLMVAEILSDFSNDSLKENVHHNDSDPQVLTNGLSNSIKDNGNGDNLSVSTRTDRQKTNGNPILTKDAWCNYMASWLQVLRSATSISLSRTRTLSQTLSVPLSLTYTHSRTHSLTHSLSHSLSLQANSERRHNLIVVVPSTPAQYFHCLRRQIHR